MEIHLAIEKAIDECIEEGILVEFFEGSRDMIITADAIDGTIERREFFAREEGRIEERRELIEGALCNGKTPKDISNFLNISMEEVLSIQQSMKGKIV